MNSPQPPLEINNWLTQSARELKRAGIESARLDAEIILAHSLRKSRTYLHAHLDECLSERAHEVADARLQLRLERTPIAYIIGHKEFYGRQFNVSPATLIPRPESEEIVTIIKQALLNSTPLLMTNQLRLIDVGTGSGCLGISIKCELPEVHVSLSDISSHALTVARSNAQALGVKVDIVRSDLLTAFTATGDYDAIVANLPYVDKSWERSPELRYEPAISLYAEDSGLALIRQLIAQVPSRLKPGGLLALEADPRQFSNIIEAAADYDFKLEISQGFCLLFKL